MILPYVTLAGPLLGSNNVEPQPYQDSLHDVSQSIVIPGCLTLTPSIHLLHKLRETDSLRVWWSLIPRGLGAVQGRLSGLKSGGCHWQRKAHGSNSSELAASSKTANSGHVEPTKQPLSKFLKACCCNQLPVDLQSKVDLKTQPFAT